MIYGTDMGGFASGFVHKRLIRAAKGFVTGGPLAAIGGFVSGTSRPAEQLPVRRPAPRSTTARPSARSAAEKEAGRALKFGNGSMAARSIGETRGGCIFPFRRDPITGQCKIFLGERTGPNGGPVPERGERLPPVAVGEAVMGRFGAAYFPGSKIVDRAICLPGDVVGVDGLCYPKATLRVRERAWPPGRKPLLTGGDMRAISTAARAGRRLEIASKRLQKIGLMKKPAPRRKLLTSGPTVHHHHDSEH